MSPKPSPQGSLELLPQKLHAACVICGRQHPRGMKIPFRPCKDGSVQSSFSCSRILQGYSGIVHGGVIAAILDGAMTNCLFFQGKIAVTGELSVRFLSPLVTGNAVTVRARIKKSVASWHLMESELRQNERLVAKGTAKFMECSEHYLRRHSHR